MSRKTFYKARGTLTGAQMSRIKIRQGSNHSSIEEVVLNEIQELKKEIAELRAENERMKRGTLAGSKFGMNVERYMDSREESRIIMDVIFREKDVDTGTLTQSELEEGPKYVEHMVLHVSVNGFHTLTYMPLSMPFYPGPGGAWGVAFSLNEPDIIGGRRRR